MTMTIFQLDSSCTEETLEEFFMFVKETLKKGLDITVMVKQPHGALNISNKTEVEKLAEIARLLGEAKEFQSQNNYASAIELYKNILSLNSTLTLIENEINVGLELTKLYLLTKDQENFLDFLKRTTNIIERMDEDLKMDYQDQYEKLKVEEIKYFFSEGLKQLDVEEFQNSINLFTDSIQRCHKLPNQQDLEYEIQEKKDLAIELQNKRENEKFIEEFGD